MQEVSIKDAPACLNTSDKAMRATGYNEAVKAMQCQGCDVPKDGLHQIAEPAVPLVGQQEVPTEQQILDAAEKAGLLPNTVHSWMPAIKRYHEALATHLTQQGLDAPVLDNAWKARLLDGRELERDEHGFGFHPELPEFEESTDVRKFFEAIGVEIQCTSADGDLDCEEYDRMSGTDTEGPFDFTDWKPSAPTGEGWKLVSIHDTEDGPYAMWLREAVAAQAKQGGVDHG